ncbi:MAG: PepSY domain-containing protein, partial [Nitrosomonadaceae bacterium]
SGSLIFAASGCDSEKEEKIQWSSVPAVVQKTITEHAGGGKIEEIEKETKTKDGKPITVYEVEVKKSDGKEIEIKVGEDGNLIEIEDD